MTHPLLARFDVDRSPQAQQRLMQAWRPLVASVARRYLRRHEDIEDAVQETLLKLVRHADAIPGEPELWLTTAAHTTCIDLIRRNVSQQRRQQGLASLAPPEVTAHRHTHDQIHARLHLAMRELDPPTRELIAQRFFTKVPLRVIAGQLGISPATASRRVHNALADLAAVLEDMGVRDVDDLTLAEHFGDPMMLPDTFAGEGLRFAPDWRALGPNPASHAATALMPGWSRPIRVGAFLSYSNTVVPAYNGPSRPIESQVHSLEFLTDPGFELVSIVEPDTSDRGPVEVAMRSYGLTAGLLDVTDTQGLQTLDVILLGSSILTAPIAKAIHQAVHAGVGLLKEWYLSPGGADLHASHWWNPDMAALLLADSPVYQSHLSRCGLQVPATVREEHPLLGPLQPGDRMLITGCGPVFRPRPGARVLITKNYTVTPQQHGIAGLGTVEPPAYIVGQIGRGRVVVAQCWRFGWFGARTLGQMDHLATVLAWLAAPRRDLAQAGHAQPTNAA